MLSFTLKESLTTNEKKRNLLEKVSSTVKIVRINHSERNKEHDNPPISIALGSFDGVHLGHQKVIGEAKRVADENGWSSAVMTFDPHPSIVLGGKTKKVDYLTSFEAKVEQLANLGIDYLFIVDFTIEFASLPPQEFVDLYLIGLNVKHVVAGFDYTYGKKAQGTAETLSIHSRGKYKTTIIGKETFGGEKVSSTLIRSLINNGEMEKVPALLGRYYSVNGTVIHGDKRGRTIGFPTANVKSTSDVILPPLGVYAVRFFVNDQWYEGVCNLGTKPTFQPDEKKISIEVHIFDFHQDIYGHSVIVEWHKRIRSEQKFNGIDELVAQIEKDKQTALQYFYEKAQ